MVSGRLIDRARGARGVHPTEAGQLLVFHTVFVAGHSGGSALAPRAGAPYDDIDGLGIAGFRHSNESGAALVPATFHPAAEDPKYPASPDVRMIVRPRPGHDLNLQLSARATIELIRGWLDWHG